MLDARERGLVRHIGMTTHNPENLLLALKRYPIETRMFPIDFAVFLRTEYGKQVLDELAEREVGIVAIKSMAARPWRQGEERRRRKCWYKPLDDPHEIDLAVRWALEQPITTIIPSGHAELFSIAARPALRFRPLTAEEQGELAALAANLTPLSGNP